MHNVVFLYPTNDVHSVSDEGGLFGNRENGFALHADDTERVVLSGDVGLPDKFVVGERHGDVELDLEGGRILGEVFVVGPPHLALPREVTWVAVELVVDGGLARDGKDERFVGGDEVRSCHGIIGLRLGDVPLAHEEGVDAEVESFAVGDGADEEFAEGAVEGSGAGGVRTDN